MKNENPESAESLIAYIRGRQNDEDGSGEWMPFALMDLEHTVREEDREKHRLAHERLADAVAARVIEKLGAKPEAKANVASDRNLATIAEFAAALDVAQSTVFVWLTRGLPSVKTKGLGRRILRSQAEAWLIGGGPNKSRIAKRLARSARNGAPS